MRRIPERARAHLLAHPDQSPADAAAALGLTYGTVKQYRSALIKAGLLPALTERPIDDEVIERLAAGESYWSIQRRGGGAPSRLALRHRLYRRGLRLCDVIGEARYGTREICRMFGYAPRNPGFLRRLQAAGVRIQSDSGPVRPGSRAYISADDLMRFLDDPANWHLFRISQITDPDWRDYAQTAQDRHHLRTGACSGPARPCEACGAVHRRPQPERRCRRCDAEAIADRERRRAAASMRRIRQAAAYQ